MNPLEPLKSLLLAEDPAFWSALSARTDAAAAFDELLSLSRLRRQAMTRLTPPPAIAKSPLRLALLAGCSLYPLSEVLEHLLAVAGIPVQLFAGEYDNYQSEIRDPDSALYAFQPQMVLLVPASHRCRYDGALADSHELVREAAAVHAREIHALCETLHRRTDAEVLLANFMLPSQSDPGPLRAKFPAAPYTFRKLVNLELGLGAPSYVQICDLEFLANRRGLAAARDDRAWFESKQMGSLPFQLDVAREIARLIRAVREPSAKVLALDLDNTLWGGVIGDDLLEGIEIGDTSPVGEAFKAFQKQVLELSRRGVLLAVCSKNDPAKAAEPFEKHPEMLLRMDHFSSFYANWSPKSENLRAIARELNLGLDSLVFVDDNPAEIEIVRQFVPEVRTVLLGPDPADYARALQDCGFFEPRTVTAEDLVRGQQYRQEQQRKSLLESVTDMDAYLTSLEMTARLTPFRAVDVPRIAQLINKSNQFNVTTIRRTEAEVSKLIGDPARPSFVVRLADRFGDHGLIAVVITEIAGEGAERTLAVETWVMSCRVLKRQVEDEVTNELVRLAGTLGCTRVSGRFVPTQKNQLVRDLFPSLGFVPVAARDPREAGDTALTFVLDLASFEPRPSRIAITREVNTP